MYLVTCFLVWGKKDPPTPLHLDVCTIHRLTNQSVTWLIDCYSWVGVNDPNHSCTQMPSIFTGLRNYQCQNQFIIHFTHRSGGRVKILNLSWIQSVCRFPVSPVAAYFLQLFHMSSLLDRLKVWIGIVRFFSLLNIKQSPNLGYKKNFYMSPVGRSLGHRNSPLCEILYKSLRIAICINLQLKNTKSSKMYW